MSRYSKIDSLAILALFVVAALFVAGCLNSEYLKDVKVEKGRCKADFYYDDPSEFKVSAEEVWKTKF